MAGPEIPPAHPLFRAVLAAAFDADETNALAAAQGYWVESVRQQGALLAAMRQGWTGVAPQLARQASFLPLDFDAALAEAARAGQVAAMREARDRGGKSAGWALVNAAGAGQLEAMRVALEWGAKNFDAALTAATYNGRLDAMCLAKRAGATNFTMVLHVAKTDEARRLLEQWDAEDAKR